MSPVGLGPDGRRRTGRALRVAAVGDIHYNGQDPALLSEIVKAAEREADVLALCGDLTTHGTPAQMEGVARVLGGLPIPVVTVLGNHDYEGGEVAAMKQLLAQHHVQVLDGDGVVIDGVGFAGVKGFAGGFGRGSLGAFGEPVMKAFVQEAVDEALKLENALRAVAAPVKVALLHYSPIVETLAGEPETIYPFLGSSRLLPPIDALEPAVVFHGHAHTGVLSGRTPAGVPVYNVAHPVLVAAGRAPILLHTVEIPAAAAGVPAAQSA